MPFTIDRRSLIIGGAAAGLARPLVAANPRSDPDWLRLLLTTLHPGLYRYQTPREFDARFARFARAWAARPDFGSRYLALARLLGAIRCGHTYVNPYNQSKAVVAAMTAGKSLLPFRLAWIDEAMVVTADPLGVGLAPGTTIRSMDRRPTSAILAALMPLARADGHNDAKRRALLEVRGDDLYEEFDLYYPLLFPAGPRFRLDVVHPDGKRETRSVAAIDRAARLAQRAVPEELAPDSPVWTWQKRGRTALLTMPGWALYDSKWNWQGWLDARFADAARDGTSGLVIDLRGNEGGYDCGDRILAYLASTPVKAEPYRRLIRFREVPAELRPPLTTWDKSFFALGKHARPAPGGYLELPPADSGGSNVIAPRAPRFAGKVAVLIEPMNSSATFGFAQRIRDSGLATLIGRPTGGNRRGINGGAFFFATLPGSGIEFDMPLIGTFAGRPQPDAGIVPDIAVPLTAAAIAAGRDDALAAAIAHVA